ncbi:MAG TPA: hypothetical protein VMT27_07320 [Actinomycetes bacterium]|nr:hypothetical protein [Actinomycetes bacterium]
MCCVVALMALIGPRIAFLFAWIFTGQVDQAYDGFLVPFFGMLLLPWTALFYAIAYAPGTGVGGFGLFFVLLGVLLDISSYASGQYSRRSS